MTQADSVHSTPPTNTSSDIPLELPEKPVEGLHYPTPVTPEEAFQAIGKLRKEARDEINRLIQFIDKTDDYVSRELEDDGDQGDASYPESGRHCERPMEDDEETGDENEPSLGSVEQHPFPYSTMGGDGDQTRWAAGNRDDCEGEEHDGAEPEHEGDDNPDNEPSLGWTVDGCIANTSERGCDCEAST